MEKPGVEKKQNGKGKEGAGKKLFNRLGSALAGAAALGAVSAASLETAHAEANSDRALQMEMDAKLKKMNADLSEARAIFERNGVKFAPSPKPRELTPQEQAAETARRKEFDELVAETKRLSEKSAATIQRIIHTLEQQNASVAEKIKVLTQERDKLLQKQERRPGS